jgi:hypothetical protein
MLLEISKSIAFETLENICVGKLEHESLCIYLHLDQFRNVKILFIF